MTAAPTGPVDCPSCGNSGRVRVANKRPYLSWAYKEWDEPCPDCAAAPTGPDPRTDAAVTGYECDGCGVTAADISREGVDPELWFERGDDGVMRCGGCEAIRSANQRYADGDW